MGRVDDPALGSGRACLFASYGPDQETRATPSYTAIQVTYCGFGQFTPDWSPPSAYDPTQSIGGARGCVTTTLSPTTDPPMTVLRQGG